MSIQFGIDNLLALDPKWKTKKIAFLVYVKLARKAYSEMNFGY